MRGPAPEGTGMTRRVEHVMGTTVTFDVRTPSLPADALEAAIARLHEIDE